MALPLFPIRGRVVLISFVGATAALTYSITLSLLKPEKIDLRTVQPPKDSRVAPAGSILPNRWSIPEESKSNTTTAASQTAQVKPKSAEAKDANSGDTEEDTAETAQTAPLPAGCFIPAGGGPPINASFEPC